MPFGYTTRDDPSEQEDVGLYLILGTLFLIIASTLSRYFYNLWKPLYFTRTVYDITPSEGELNITSW
jgi:hypothetical protein